MNKAIITDTDCECVLVSFNSGLIKIEQQNKINNTEQTIIVNWEQFGKLLNTVMGVVNANRRDSRIKKPNIQ